MKSTIHTKPVKGGPKWPKQAIALGLYPHPKGQWCKTIGRRSVYCGSWKQGQTWQAAWEEFKVQARAIENGRDPKRALLDYRAGDDPGSRPAYRVRDMVRDYIAWKRQQVRDGERSPRVIGDLIQMGDILIERWGDRGVLSITTDDFSELRSWMTSVKGGRRAWGFRRTNKMVVITRSFFHFARKERKIPLEVEFGVRFTPVRSRTLDEHDRQQDLIRGKKMFEPEHILALLRIANPVMRAMILLGINCGFENECIARLTIAEVESLIEGWHSIPRPKTTAGRSCNVWPETQEALTHYLTVRPTPKPEWSHIAFLTKPGRPWAALDRRAQSSRVNDTQNAAISKEFGRLLDDLGIKRKGVSFYALRHTLATIGLPRSRGYAVQAILGHIPPGVTKEYIHDVPRDSIVEVTDTVRAWLFSEEAKARAEEFMRDTARMVAQKQQERRREARNAMRRVRARRKASGP